MEIAMTPPEVALLKAFLKQTSTYVEFGTGGSTYLAASTVGTSVVSLDSSEAWLGQVAECCIKDELKIQPKLIFADIGPTGDWGRPTDPKKQHLWPNYYNKMWLEPASQNADLYLIDGRFRVSCFMAALTHCRDDSVVLVHDFTSRPEYHIVREVAREFAAAGDLSAFIAGPNRDKEKLHTLLDKYAYNPA